MGRKSSIKKAVKKDTVLVKKRVLNQYLTELKNIKTNNTFINYTLIKVKKQIEKEFEVLKESIQIPPKFLEYDSKRRQILLSCAKKDEAGKPVINNGNAVLDPEKASTFENEVKKLQKEYKKAISEYEEQSKLTEELLDTEVEIEVPMKFSLDKIPSDMSMQSLETLVNLGIIKE